MMLQLHPLMTLLRPAQWLKNLMLFFPLFLSGSVYSVRTVVETGFVSFLSFCSVASALYIFNDICDSEKDASHPVKRLRPLPSGAVSRRSAFVLALLLVLSGLVLAVSMMPKLLLYIVLYIAVTIAYSIWLKKFPVIDLFCISTGFLIRLQAGGSLFEIKISEWLFLSVFFLSLFLSSGKRLAEQKLLGAACADHRVSLQGYPDGALEAILQITAAAALVTYTMYSLAHSQLVYTVPLCTFGLFRYIVRVRSGSCGDPTESLLKDVPLLCVSVLWVVLVGWSIYW